MKRPCAALILILTATAVSFAQKADAVFAIQAALRQGDATRALDLARQAARTAPQDERIALLEGIAYQQLGQPQPALQQFKRALLIAPDSLPALEGAAELEYQQNSPRAVPLLDRLAKLRPADPTVHAMLAVMEYRRGDCGAAVPQFQSGMAVVAGQAPALEEYGACLVRLRRPQEAIPIFRRLMEARPAQPWPRYNLAVVQSMAHQDEAAMQTLAPVLASDAPPAPVLSLAADLAEATGNTPNAVHYLRQAIIADPSDARNYVQFATLSFDHASFQAGVAMLDAGLKRLPRASSLYLARGVLYVQMGKYAEGEADFETANRLNPHQTFGSVGQGLAEFESGDLGRAVVSLRAQLARHPKDAYLHYLLAEVLVQKGAAAGTPQYRAAEASARQALRLRPEFPMARDLLADLYLHAGRVSAAIAQSRLALKSDPNDLTALYHLVLALRRTRQTGEIPALLKRLAEARQAARQRDQRDRRYRLFIQNGNASPAPPGSR